MSPSWSHASARTKLKFKDKLPRVSEVWSVRQSIETATGPSELGAWCLVVSSLPAELTSKAQYSKVNVSALPRMLIVVRVPGSDDPTRVSDGVCQSLKVKLIRSA